MENYPFLYFQPPVTKGLVGRQVFIKQPHCPGKAKQVERVSLQLEKVKATFDKITLLSQQASLGMVPETILVMEIAGSIKDFKQALEEVGFEWLDEWDEDDLEPDDNFYWTNPKGIKTSRKVQSKLFISMANQSAMQQMLTLWNQWKKEENFVHGTSKWKVLFNQLINIRTWGPQESLYQTGMADRWQDLLDPIKPEEKTRFQIDFFYRNNQQQREKLNTQLSTLLSSLGGKCLNTLVIEAIRFHGIKAELPAAAVKSLLEALANNKLDEKINLLNFPGIMYFKPTGQSINTANPSELVEELIQGDGEAQKPPIALLLDGLPLAKHQALTNNLIIDDIFSLAPHYQPSEELHATSMASLIMRGDLNVANTTTNQLVCIPILQPNPSERERGVVGEYIPDDIFIEQRVLEAVEYLAQQRSETDIYANICIINFSIGLADQIFNSSPSPLAKLIDWLSYKYNLLFFISAGNYTDTISLGMPYNDWQELNQEAKIQQLFLMFEKNKQSKRMLAPAESINSLTLGGYHTDELGIYNLANRLDPLFDLPFPSLISRIGNGFK